MAAEFALPEPIPKDHGGRLTAAQIVFRTEEAASGGRNPERGKEFAAHAQDGNAARLGALADAFASVSTIPCENAGERLLVLADLLEQRIAEIVRIVGNAKAVPVGDLDAG